MSDFPDEFVWGAATAAYQIEGAHDQDGKGQSIWDTFSHSPGRVANGDTGDVACDHYHRWQEDVALMRELGLSAYRFSISWPRLLPEGTGKVNSAGVDFYSRLVDTLLAAGITPFVTLYHWDLPQALQDRGGFCERDVADWFAEYAELVGRSLGDRVKHFITLNEPQVFGVLGHLSGMHAPGIVDFRGYVAAAHHINLAHGRAVSALRAAAQSPLVGTTLQTPPIYPVSDGEADVRAARRFDGVFNRWYLDAVLLGRYPSDMLELFEPLEPPIEPGDLEIISQTIDFLGVNNYSRIFVRHAQEVPLFGFAADETALDPKAPTTAMGWEVFPEGIHQLLVRLRRSYGNPRIFITENGCALDDRLENGRVDDTARIEFLKSYLAQVRRAIHEGSRVDGYFVWSLLDNFEWAHGYSKRFGLVHVDYDSLTRTPKQSYQWYRRVIQNNGLVI